uniref:Uncharacterized protein n=1 Tax=Anguilla anguilla TaxID=7936 RepID=A0A0E9Q2Q8_ANGAN
MLSPLFVFVSDFVPMPMETMQSHSLPALPTACK